MPHPLTNRDIMPGVKRSRKKAPQANKTKTRAKTKTRRAAAKKAPAKMAARRADYGAPIEAFFSKQPPELKAIVDKLRTLVEKAAPDAEASLKWGMPVYTLGGKILCAIGGHKSHVNLVLAGPPGAFADPGRRLAGSGKTGRHLKITKLAELPTDAVRGWLETAAELARKK